MDLVARLDAVHDVAFAIQRTGEGLFLHPSCSTLAYCDTPGYDNWCRDFTGNFGGLKAFLVV